MEFLLEFGKAGRFELQYCCIDRQSHCIVFFLMDIFDDDIETSILKDVRRQQEVTKDAKYEDPHFAANDRSLFKVRKIQNCALTPNKHYHRVLEPFLIMLHVSRARRPAPIRGMLSALSTGVGVENLLACRLYPNQWTKTPHLFLDGASEGDVVQVCVALFCVCIHPCDAGLRANWAIAGFSVPWRRWRPIPTA